MHINLQRIYQPDHTLGLLSINGNDFRCPTIELPNFNNQQNVSFIPVGTYEWIKHKSRNHGDCLWLQNVYGRSEILIHSGNHVGHTLGCILPGAYYQIGKVAPSRPMIKKMIKILPAKGTITIKGV